MVPSESTDALTDDALPPVPRIVQTGNPVLRAAAEKVTQQEIETPEFRALVDMMVAVMRAAPGVGLAAPQIGVPKQVIVLEDREEFIARLDPEALAARERVVLPLTVVVNPSLQLVEGRSATFLEGCLSVTGYVALVRRAIEVEVTGLDATGPDVRPRVWRVRGWPARIFQHEVDHLRGTLYIDRMYPRSLCGPEETHRWTGKTPEEMAAALGVDLMPD
jgi:peptide deformylase